MGVLESISLRDELGTTIDFTPRLPMPFSTSEFDESAYLGTISIPVSLEAL